MQHAYQQCSTIQQNFIANIGSFVWKLFSAKK